MCRLEFNPEDLTGDTFIYCSCFISSNKSLLAVILSVDDASYLSGLISVSLVCQIMISSD